MSETCRVRISGHKDADDIEADARHHIRDGRHYVFFEKLTDGEEEKFSLKFDGKGLEYSRRGMIKSTVILKTGEMTASTYRTPYGEFEIGFFTRSYELSEERGSGKIILNAGYDMTLNGQPHEPGNITIELFY